MIRTPTAETRVVAVIGSPVTHSSSPILHNAAFAKLGLDWIYVAHDVALDAGYRAVEAMRTLGLAGMNITMPLKDVVAQTADRLTPVAEKLGAVNTLFWLEGEIVGDSTDGDGFVAAFEREAPKTIRGATVAVLGTGGAARAIVEALGRAGAAKIVVAGRDNARTQVAASLAPQAEPCDYGEFELLAQCEIIVNATSIGMAGGPDPSGIPLPEHLIEQNHIVSDIVYHPRQTPLLAASQAKGAHVVGGIGMLVQQAALSFSLWTGLNAPIDVMIAEIERSS